MHNHEPTDPFIARLIIDLIFFCHVSDIVTCAIIYMSLLYLKNIIICLDNILKHLEFYNIIICYVKACCFCLIIRSDISPYYILFLSKLTIFRISPSRKAKTSYKSNRLLDVSCRHTGLG